MNPCKVALVALRSVYRVSKEERHDVAMRRERLLAPLLALLERAMPADAPLEGMTAPLPAEALVYACGALKNATANDEGNQKVMGEGRGDSCREYPPVGVCIDDGVRRGEGGMVAVRG